MRSTTLMILSGLRNISSYFSSKMG